MSAFLSHLRRWFAGAAIAVVLIVAGVYFYAHHRVQNALKQVPEKIGLEIQQSASGFSVSKSEQGRTILKIDASKAVQFKQGGLVELHNVVITVYGRDSARYDRIYGSDFEYNQQSGDVTALGEVQIDLEANPKGVLNPDQSPPEELRNPVHLKTRGLVFNQKTGDAHTSQKVEFQLPQASGSGVGLNYIAKNNVLTLESQVRLVGTGPSGLTLTAARAVITKDPHQVVVELPRLEMTARESQADRAILFLRSDNTLDRVLASGNVLLYVTGQQVAEARAEQLELTMGKQGGNLYRAVLSGAVKGEFSGEQELSATAGRVQLDFAGRNVLTKVRAEGAAKITQHQKTTDNSAAQDMELTASTIDFFLKDGNHLTGAVTIGPGQITLLPSTGSDGSETVATAGSFQARFDDSGQLTAIHGAPDACLVSRSPGQPDRVSTSAMLDAGFRSGGEIESIVQQGSVAYVDGERKAWGDRARYVPDDQILLLTGSPRIVEGGMTTTGYSMRLNRGSKEAFAEGSVRTTYSDLNPHADGALLASSSPIHVTSDAMAVHGTSAVALYTGHVRLWQDANIVEAPSIEFDRERRSMIARGTTDQPVSTVLVQTDASGNVTPVAITSSRLSYTDNQRQAHFDGEVTGKGADVTLTAKQMDAFLQPRGESTNQASSAGRIEKIVAKGQVVVTQPDRRATGDQLVYTAADDKFILTGGPPSIFDAEHGKITGVSLTFFRRDDRVLVEGNNKFPTVTQTRVAR